MTRRFYDSVSATAIPGDAQLVGGYVDGHYAWSTADWDRWAHVPHIRIAVFDSSTGGNCLDVERYAATPAGAPVWARRRRAAGETVSVYCNKSTWPAVVAAFNAAGQAQPLYWIADWDGVQAIYDGSIAKQYMNGSSYDFDIAADYWPGVDPAPAPPPKPPAPPPPPPPPAPAPTPQPISEDDMASILVVDGNDASGNEIGAWLLSGSLYVHIPDPTTLGTLQNPGGLKESHISVAMHNSLLAGAAALKGTLAGSLGVSGNLTVS